MERAAPVRKSHTSTADLRAWPQQADEPRYVVASTSLACLGAAVRGDQVSVVFGGQVTEEEAESLNKRKPCSAPKWKEMTGSGIFAAEANDDV